MFAGPFSRVGTRIKAEQAKTAGGFGVKPHPEDPFFWCEKPSFLRCHFLLNIYQDRLGTNIENVFKT
jgi:hypothetical protein